MTTTLDDAIEEFRSFKVPHIPFKARSYIVGELADPDIAEGRCASVSHWFYEELWARRFPEVPTSAMRQATLESGITLLWVTWRRQQGRHLVVLFNGTVIDWSARQYAHDVAFPLVESIYDYANHCEGNMEDAITHKVMLEAAEPTFIRLQRWACDEVQIVADLSTPTGYRDALEAAYSAGWYDAEQTNNRKGS